MWRISVVFLLTAILAEYTWAQRSQGTRGTANSFAYEESGQTQRHEQQQQSSYPSGRGINTVLNRHKRQYDCPYPPHLHGPPPPPPPPFWPPPPPYGPPPPPPYWPPPPPQYSQAYSNAAAESNAQAQGQAQAQAQAQSESQVAQQAPPCDSCGSGISSATSNAKSEYGEAIAVAIARAKKERR